MSRKCFIQLTGCSLFKMKNIPLYILDKLARREEEKLKELRLQLELPILPPRDSLYEKAEEPPPPYEPLIIDMS